MTDDDFNFDFDDAPAVIPEPIVSSFPELDSEFDLRFKELTEGYADDEEVLRNASAIMEAESIISKAEIERAALQAEVEEIEAELKAIEKKRIELANKKARVNEGLWDIRKKINPTKVQIAAQERALAVAKEQRELIARQQFLTSRLDEIAAKFPWFTGLENGYKILPHQLEGAKFLATAHRAILGDEMGIGKTLTSIAALDLHESKRALVVAPADVTTNFIDEIQMWAKHRPVINIKGMSKAERNMTLKFMREGLNEFVVVTNYEAWRKDMNLLTVFGDMEFDSIILDEAHVIKDTTGIAYRGIDSVINANNVCPRCPGHPFMPAPEGVSGDLNTMRMCKTCGWAGHSFEAVDEEGKMLTFEEKLMLPRSVKNVTVMTGTVILNSPLDLFSLLSIVDPINFPSKKKTDFLRQYCEQDVYTGRYKFHEGGLEHLVKTRLRGLFLARTKKDAGIKLPPMKPIKHMLELTEERYPDQYRVVQQLNKHAEIVLSDGRTLSAMAIIALITRQRQANVYPGGIQIKDPLTKEIVLSVSEEVTESIKIDKAIEIIKEQVAAGERVVLFSQFTTALEEIEARLNADTVITEEGVTKIRAVTMTGKTSQSVKDQVKTNFDRKMGEVPKWDVVLANYKSGGVGLNFTAATHAIVLDREWNPGKEDQALARIFRIGQTEETFVHTLEVEGSIDVWLNGLIDEKADLIAGFNTSSRDMQEAYLKALKTGEIK